MRKGTPSLGRPPASLWRIQCGLQMLTTVTNCLLSTSLNIPMRGNQKKAQDPLQASKNSHPLTATTVFQTLLYVLFIHTLVTLSFFAYRTGSAHLLQLRCCASYRTRDTALHTSRNSFFISYLQNLVSSPTNAKKFLYRIRNSPLISTQMMFCTEQYDKTTCFGPAYRS